MKRVTKSWLLALCAVLIVAGTVAGTLAYLTDREEVVNTFTVGNVAIDLDEADVNPDGSVIAGAPRVKENQYHLIPGWTYTKDPTVTVKANSEESYIRMMVTINVIDELNAIFPEGFLPENFVAGWDPVIWQCVAAVDNGDNTVTYEFRYHKTVSTMDGQDLVLEPLFTAFTLPGEITGPQLQTIQTLTIAVEGHAIQALTFANADEAWAAFQQQYNP